MYEYRGVITLPNRDVVGLKPFLECFFVITMLEVSRLTKKNGEIFWHLMGFKASSRRLDFDGACTIRGIVMCIFL